MPVIVDFPMAVMEKALYFGKGGQMLTSWTQRPQVNEAGAGNCLRQQYDRSLEKGKAGDPLNKMIETFYNVLVNFRNIQWNHFGSLDLHLLPLAKNRLVHLVNPGYTLLFLNIAP